MLRIIDLNGRHLANLDQGAGGELTPEIIDENCRTDLEALLKSLEGKDMYLVGGGERMQNGQLVFETTRRAIQPGDPDYLKGIQDWLARKKVTLGGQRVRGLLVSPKEADHG